MNRPAAKVATPDIIHSPSHRRSSERAMNFSNLGRAVSKTSMPLLLDQMNDFMRFWQRGKAGALIVLTDVNPELAVALDRDRVRHDGELGHGGANITIAGDLELLCGEIHDAVHLDLAAADDEVFRSWDRRGMLGEGNAFEASRVRSGDNEICASLSDQTRGVVTLKQNGCVRSLQCSLRLHLKRTIAENIDLIGL